MGDLLAQRPDQSYRQHRDAILVALAVAHQDFATSEIDVLDAQAHRLHDSQASAIEQ